MKKIDKGTKIDDIIFIKYLKKKNSTFLPAIIDIINSSKIILNNRITHVFPNFTLHDIEHSYRIMQYMSELIPNYKELNELEITMLIYVAILHDIGMAVSDEDLILIKSDKYPYCDIKYSTMKKYFNDNESVALQEYVRRIHATMSAQYIITILKDKLIIPNFPTLNFANEIALICQSHTEDFDWIKGNLTIYEVMGDYYFNAQFIACILRLSDILDIDNNRTPYNLYQLIAPKGISDEEWKQNFIISNNKKIIFDEKTNQKKIVFHGKVNNARTHRKILTYIGWVKNEIANSTNLTSNMLPQYRLVFNNNPEINIQTIGYTFSDYKMTLEFKAISSLLMGEKIYGSKSLGLRELIQNSIDACRLREETEKSELEFGEDPYSPKIKVILDKNKAQVIIKDNGLGMSNKTLKKHFLNIGVSYYNSTDFLLKDFNYKPIGNFGIGFLSCFMLSEEVRVITRYYKSKYKYEIELERGNEYTSFTETEDVVFEGTEVILNYSDFMEVFENKPEKILKFLNKYFLTDGIEFELVDKSSRTKFNVSNLIRINKKLEKGMFKIDLQNYLNEIEGYAIIKKNSNFIKQFEDLIFSGVLYLYDNKKGLQKVHDKSLFNIDDYLLNKEIKYLLIPLVPTSVEDDFLSGYRFTEGDTEEVISKMNRDLNWISIIVPKEYQNELDSGNISNDDYIFENLSFNDLVVLGHSKYCETASVIESIKLFEGKKNQLYLPFDNKSNLRYIWYTDPLEQELKELFMRNVLIQDFHYDFKVSASIFETTSIITNINSRKFIPDISRNNIDNEGKNLINYIIGKTLHLGASANLGLSSDEHNTMEDFIHSFYNKNTEFEK